MSAPIGYNLSPDILLLNTVKQNFCQKHDSGILVLYCWYLSIKWSWLDFKPAPSYRNFHVLYWWNMQSMSQKCKKNCFHFHLCSIGLILLRFGRTKRLLATPLQLNFKPAPSYCNFYVILKKAGNEICNPCHRNVRKIAFIFICVRYRTDTVCLEGGSAHVHY